MSTTSPLSPRSPISGSSNSTLPTSPSSNPNNYEFKIIFSKQDVSIYPSDSTSKGIEGVISLYYSYDTVSSSAGGSFLASSTSSNVSNASSTTSATGGSLLGQSLIMMNPDNNSNSTSSSTILSKSVILSWTPVNRPSSSSTTPSIDIDLPSNNNNNTTSSNTNNNNNNNNPLKRSQPISIGRSAGSSMGGFGLNPLSSSSVLEKPQQEYQQLKINIRDINSIKKYTPTIGTPYVIVLGKNGTALPPFFFENGGVREFLKSLQSVSNIRKSSLDSNLYINDDNNLTGLPVFTGTSVRKYEPFKRVEGSLQSTTLPTDSQEIIVSQNVNNKPLSPLPSPNPKSTSGSFLGPTSPLQQATAQMSLSPKTPLSLSTVLERDTQDHSSSFSSPGSLLPLSTSPQDPSNVLASSKEKKKISKEISSNILESFAKVSNFAKSAQKNIFEDSAKRIDNTFRNLTQSLGSKKTSPQHSNNASLNSSLSSSTGDYFTPFNLTQSGFLEDLTVNRKECNPLSANEWYSYFDEEGRINLTNQTILRKKIFYGGIHDSIRSEVWPYLLGCYQFDSTHAEREAIKYERTREYLTIKKQWQSISSDQEKRFSKFTSRRMLIDKDVIRTDRLHPLFAGDDNPNLQTIKDILLTYSFYNFDIGYVQGMSDLLTPIYSVFQKEVDSFWCFVGLMERLESNFHKDQNGMHSQLTTLSKLLKYMDIDLYNHFELIDGTNMYFFFQSILICFKREFQFENSKTLWEILWSNYLTKQLPIFMCLSILMKERSMIVEENLQFDQILKLINGKAGKMDLDDILVFSESVVIYFVAKVNSENLPPQDPSLRALCESVYQY